MEAIKAGNRSSSTENFLKALYNQSKDQESDKRTGTLARKLRVSNAAATEMARKLAAKDLVNYTKYKELTLTPKGQGLALNVIRKHRLWESFLFQTLHLSLHEIHREAELLEHLTSDFLANKISEFLGNPTEDPHGDPIPGQDGFFHQTKETLLLSEALPGQDYQVSRLSGSEEDFLNFCVSNQITVGNKINIEKQYSSGKMTEIMIAGNRIVLNHEFTNMIYVKKND